MRTTTGLSPGNPPTSAASSLVLAPAASWAPRATASAPQPHSLDIAPGEAVRCARVCANRRTQEDTLLSNEDLLKLLQDFGQRSAPDSNNDSNNNRSAELGGMSADDVFVSSAAGWDSHGDVGFGAFVDVISDNSDAFEVEAAASDDLIGAEHEHADAYIDVVLNNLRQEDADPIGLDTLCRTLDGDDDHLGADADDGLGPRAVSSSWHTERERERTLAKELPQTGGAQLKNTVAGEEQSQYWSSAAWPRGEQGIKQNCHEGAALIRLQSQSGGETSWLPDEAEAHWDAKHCLDTNKGVPNVVPKQRVVGVVEPRVVVRIPRHKVFSRATSEEERNFCKAAEEETYQRGRGKPAGELSTGYCAVRNELPLHFERRAAPTATTTRKGGQAQSYQKSRRQRPKYCSTSEDENEEEDEDCDVASDGDDEMESDSLSSCSSQDCNSNRGGGRQRRATVWNVDGGNNSSNNSIGADENWARVARSRNPSQRKQPAAAAAAATRSGKGELLHEPQTHTRLNSGKRSRLARSRREGNGHVCQKGRGRPPQEGRAAADNNAQRKHASCKYDDGESLSEQDQSRVSRWHASDKDCNLWRRRRSSSSSSQREPHAPLAAAQFTNKSIRNPLMPLSPKETRAADSAEPMLLSPAQRSTNLVICQRKRPRPQSDAVNNGQDERQGDEVVVVKQSSQINNFLVFRRQSGSDHDQSEREGSANAVDGARDLIKSVDDARGPRRAKTIFRSECSTPESVDAWMRCPEPGCGYGTFHAARLELHSGFHVPRDANGQRKFKYQCPLCHNQKHNSLDQLMKHYRRQHKNMPYECRVCQEETSDIKSHMKKHGPADLTCSVCKRLFKHMNSFSRHLNTHTAGPKKHKCSVCKISYVSLHSLKDHIRKVHTDGGTSKAAPIDEPEEVVESKAQALAETILDNYKTASSSTKAKQSRPDVEVVSDPSRSKRRRPQPQLASTPQVQFAPVTMTPSGLPILFMAADGKVYLMPTTSTATTVQSMPLLLPGYLPMTTPQTTTPLLSLSLSSGLSNVSDLQLLSPPTSCSSSQTTPEPMEDVVPLNEDIVACALRQSHVLPEVDLFLPGAARAKT